MLNLNGLDIPSFVTVNKINFSILPTIENNLLKVRGKAGMYNLGHTVGERRISADVTIVAKRVNGVMEATRYMAEWLYHKEPVKLIVADEPDKYYLVLLDGNTDVEEIVNVGRGTISFICVEPFAYGEEKVVQVEATEDPVQIDNKGTAEAHPIIELKVKEDITSISVVSQDGYVMLGEEEKVTDKPVDTTPLRFNEDMSNPATWTTATSVDGGVIAGEFSSNGYSFQQAIGSDGIRDYGTGAAWHGASAVKSLDKVIAKDFELVARFGFKANLGKEVGRVEIYLLDENNVQFGKIAMVDLNPSASHQRFEARAGKLAGGHYFANDWGDYRGVWSNMDEGRFTFSRTGNQWYAQVGIVDKKTGLLHTRKTKTWIDSKGIATNKLAKIQIHMAAYGEYSPVTTMYFQDIRVTERLTLGTNEAPIIARKGDILTIDNTKAVVYKNGDVFYEGLNPSSKFITLQKGANGISVLPAKADMKVTYVERWL